MTDTPAVPMTHPMEQYLAEQASKPGPTMTITKAAYLFLLEQLRAMEARSTPAEAHAPQMTIDGPHCERCMVEMESVKARSTPAEALDVRTEIIETLHRYECDDEPPGHDYREHLPEDEPEFHPNRIDALVDLYARLSSESDR
jgi:hypothetical protein